MRQENGTRINWKEGEQTAQINIVFEQTAKKKKKAAPGKREGGAGGVQITWGSQI